MLGMGVMSMPFFIIRQDITKMETTAIVSGGNGGLQSEGGVSGQIFDAAGPGLRACCAGLDGCAPGEAVVTPGFGLKAKYVIHTVGPVWRDGRHGEEHTLRRCYRSCLEAAAKLGCGSVAFPLIASGKYGYPKAAALRAAVSEIEEYLRGDTPDMDVYLTVFGRAAYLESRALFPDLESYIDDNYALARRDAYVDINGTRTRRRPPSPPAPPAPSETSPRSPDEALKHLDLPFRTLLLQYIDASGRKDSDVYNNANVNRKTFNKIKNDADYHAGKATVLALAISLRLSLDDTRRLLGALGLSLSPSSKSDIIIEYFLKSGVYDIYQINDSLFDHDEPCLGCIAE